MDLTEQYWLENTHGGGIETTWGKQILGSRKQNYSRIGFMWELSPEQLLKPCE